MKLMFASDIHGSAYYCDKIKEIYKKEKSDKLILLGDLLYHGPRNDLPKEYNPKKVVEILNSMREEILCVRGNCDCEVDQMVLDFPILADYIFLYLDDKGVLITHGHKYNSQNLPPMKKGDILIHGHTHIQAFETHTNYIYINPGSVSIPKNGNENSYMTYDDKTFKIKNLDMKIIREFSIYGDSNSI